MLIKWFAEAKEKSEDMIKDNKQKKAVYAEAFDKPSCKNMYDEASELLITLVEKKIELEKDKERKKKQS